MGPARIRDATRIPRAARAGWISVLAGLLGIGVGGALTIISSAGATTQPELRASVVECSTTVTYEVASPDGDDTARANASVGVWWREGDATGFAPAPDELPTVNALTSANGFTFSGTIDTGGAPGSVFTVRAAALEAWGDGAFAGDAVFATVTLPPACGTAPPPAESVPPSDAGGPPSTDVPTTTVPLPADPPAAPDADGVPAEIEDAAPNGGDGNADGIPDAEQANVASLPSRYDVDGNGILDDYVTIEAPALTALANVRGLDVPAKNPPPDGVSLPSGLFDYDLDVGVAGAAADVRVLLPDGEQQVVYMLADGRWRAFDAHASIDDAANEVTLHVVDGGAGDRSGADGVIHDPFGVGAPGDVATITFTKVALGGNTTTFNVELARCVGSGSPPGTAGSASDACSSVDSTETSTVLGGQSKTSGGLDTDSHWYRLRETPSTSGWSLSARSCAGGQASTTSGAPSDGIFVRLNSGAGAVCTFTNASNSITARKGGIRIAGQNTLNTFVQGIDGAAFEYATNSSFSSGLADLCTTSSSPGPTGTCTQGAISNGTKYVREKTSPAGWDKITTVAYGGGPSGPNPDHSYIEQTPNLSGTTAATTRWFMNRMTNPPLAVDTCGLKIGLLLDKSQSINGFQDQYVEAAQSFVSTLANTPTEMKLYSFGINAQTYNGGSFYDLADSGDVSSANTQISNIYSSLETGTNWDAGLQQVGSAGLDVLFVITDGNPIMWQGDTSGITVDLADVEAGIASANLVKSFGQRIVSIGVGDVTATNISLLSGPTQGSDYFTGSVEQLQQTLKDLAVSLCGGSVTVKKEVRTGPGSNDFAVASGWQYGISPAATTVAPASGQTNQNGTVNFDYAEGPWPKTVTVTETQQSGWSIVQQDGDPSGGTQPRDAACTIDGSLTPVTNAGNAAAPGVSLSVDAQDIVACSFRNEPTLSQIQVVKTTNGGAGGPFGFGVTGPNGTNAARSATTASASTPTNAGAPVTGLYPGQYTITESSLPSGWDLAGIACTGATNNGTANLADKSIVLTVGPAQSVTCTYTNSSQVGRINVVKKATGGTETFPFALTKGDNPVPGQPDLAIEAGPATPADDGTDSWTDVAAGTYAVTETTPAGWDLTSATCSDGSPVDAVVLSGGETVTCTFGNVKRGSVVIRKTGVGAGAGATFEFTVPAAFGAPGDTVSLTTQTDGSTESSQTFSLAPGTYPVTEQGPPAGWGLTNLVCDDGSPTSGPTATIELAAGEPVVCTWTNTKQGSVTVEKVGVGQGAGADFDFSVPAEFGESGDTLTLTTPTDGGSDSETFSVAPGTYDVSEDAPLPEGWDFTGLDCTNDSETEEATATIEVAAGGSVTCTWTNTKRAKVTIEKQAIGDDAASFDFEVPGAFDEPDDTLTLSTPTGGGSDSATFSIEAGTYSVTEQLPLPERWDFSSLTCSNDSEITDRTADIEVVAGETVSCTWTNTQRPENGTIVITKDGVGEGAGAAFEFSVPGAFEEPGDTLTLTTPDGGGSDSQAYSVPPDTEDGYVVSEGLPTPAHWDFTGLECTDPDGQDPATIDGAQATIYVSPAETVTCTWTNTKRAGVTIEKVGVGQGAGAAFAFSVPAGFDQSGDTLTLTTPTDGGSDSETFSVAPGTYDVSEDAPLPEGWDFTGVECTNDSATDGPDAAIDVAAGESVTCTWTNTKRADVTIEKIGVGAGAGATFDFDVPGAFGAPDDTLTLTTPTDGGSDSQGYSVEPGTYDVAEQSPLPDGWELTSLTCTNGSVVTEMSAEIAVAAGESVTCTWTNTKLPGTIVLEKTAIGEDAESFDFSVPAVFEQPDDTVSLSTPGGGGTVQSSAFEVPEGTYPVSELGPPEGWDVTDLTCTNESQVTLPTADIEVAAGESVTCTWTNTQRADVTVEKVATGTGPGAAFDFDVPGVFDEPGDTLTLTTPAGGGSDAQVFSVPPGAYPVTEQTPPAGWQLTDLACTNGSEITSPTATITVAAGESVTCTWTNTVTTARVEVVKQVAGADVADWTFDGQVSGGTAHFTGGGTAEARTTEGDPPIAAFDLEQVPAAGAAVHLVEQLQVGYGFAGVSCVVVPEQGEPQPIAANPDGASATPVVSPDQVVRCTFVNNLLPASISLVKTASASQVDAGSDTSFSIVVTNDGQVPLTNVVVTDPVPTGTTFVSATVVAGKSGVCAETGGLVTCTLDGTLGVGETSTISLVVNVPAAATPFTIVNSATVTGDPPVCVSTTDASALAGECPVTATDDATVPVIGVGGETATVDAPRVVAGTLPFTGPAGAAALKAGAWLLAFGGIVTLTTRRRRPTR